MMDNTTEIKFIYGTQSPNDNLLLDDGSLYFWLPQTSGERFGSITLKANGRLVPLTNTSSYNGNFEGILEIQAPTSIIDQPEEQRYAKSYWTITGDDEGAGVMAHIATNSSGSPVLYNNPIVENNGGLKIYKQLNIAAGEEDASYYFYLASLTSSFSDEYAEGFGFFTEATETLVKTRWNEEEGNYEFYAWNLKDQNYEYVNKYADDDIHQLHMEELIKPVLITGFDTLGMSLYRNKVISFYNVEYTTSLNSTSGEDYTRYIIGNYAGTNDSKEQINIFSIGYETENSVIKNYIAFNNEQMTLYGNNYTSLRFDTQGIKLIAWSEDYLGSVTSYNFETYYWDVWKGAHQSGTAYLEWVPQDNITNYTLEVLYQNYYYGDVTVGKEIYFTTQIPLVYYPHGMPNAIISATTGVYNPYNPMLDPLEINTICRALTFEINSSGLAISISTPYYLQPKEDNTQPSNEHLVPIRYRLIRNSGALNAPIQVGVN